METDLVVNSALRQARDEPGHIVEVVDQALDQHQEATLLAHLQRRVVSQPFLIQLHADLKQGRDALLKQVPGVSVSRLLLNEA